MNAFVSADVGGKPVRSNETRRISSRFDAARTGFGPESAINESIVASFGAWSGSRDHQLAAASSTIARRAMKIIISGKVDVVQDEILPAVVYRRCSGLICRQLEGCGKMTAQLGPYPAAKMRDKNR